MVELLPAAGMSAFALLLPITGVILLILVLVTSSYRQTVLAYTRSGGASPSRERTSVHGPRRSLRRRC